jgi:PncC family amidohydrolase
MSLLSSSRELAERLKATGHKIVFAESCTAGLAAASLAQVPGVSDYHCGGVVVYREGTKTAYLQISAGVLRKFGVVSEHVAQLMAERVLACTPEATIAVSITGHLGPQAPEGFDGIAFIGLEVLELPRRSTGAQTSSTYRIELPPVGRTQRQRLAAEALLRLATQQLGDR